MSEMNAMSVIPESTHPWERQLQELAAFKAQHGHCRVPDGWPENPSLARWVSKQRSSHKGGRMDETRRQHLDALGFDWNATGILSSEQWERRYQALTAFHAEHGHLRVPKTRHGVCQDARWAGLGDWLRHQRSQQCRGRLAPERRVRLEALGIDWEPSATPSSMLAEHQAAWDQHLQELAAFKAQHGHCRVPDGWPENPSLARWVSKQRSSHKGGRMDETRRQHLDALGFDWNATGILSSEQWERRYQALAAFHAEHGHLRVPKTRHGVCTDARWAGLNDWLGDQRSQQRRGRLAPERRVRLEALGIDWEPSATPPSMLAEHQAAWDEHLAELAAFKEQHGHCRVPDRWPENPSLARWVRKQRSRERSGRMDETRRQRLDALGFNWDATEIHYHEQWERRFQTLAAFHAEHGHLRVPETKRGVCTDARWAGLGDWIKSQRHKQRCGRLPREQRTRLEALGIDWDPVPALPRKDDGLPKDEISRWDHFYERLLAFVEAHGHANVPNRWREDRALADWVHDQRTGRIYGRLHFDQITRLEKLRFAWKEPKQAEQTPDLESTEDPMGERYW